MSGKLIIVSTPIGNLQDLTPRAAAALREADLVYAEDTRVTSKLLSHVESKAEIRRCDENVIQQRVAQVVDEVASGLIVAYASDAGTPGISDPGIALVDAILDRGLRAEVLPGPVAAVVALVASGLYPDNFYFAGFPPRKESARLKYFSSLAHIAGSLIFYESPHRVVDTLIALTLTFPNRTAAVCRELTKLHEEVVRLPLRQLTEEFVARGAIKGEIVIVVDAPRDQYGKPLSPVEAARIFELKSAGKPTTLHQFICEQLGKGVKKSRIAKDAAEIYDAPRNDVYDLIVELERRINSC